MRSVVAAGLALAAACTPATAQREPRDTTPPAVVTGASATPSATASASASALPACGPAPAFASPQAVAAPEAAAAACAKAEAASARALGPVGKAGLAPGDAPGGLGRCLGAADGAWLLAVERVEASPAGARGRWRAWRFAADGKVTKTRLGGEVGDVGGGRHEAAALEAAFDVDGDGATEILVRTESWYGGGEDASDRRTAYRRNGDELVAIALPVDRAIDRGIEAIADVDGDGRVDLVLRSPFAVGVPCTLDGEARGPRLLAHATAGGLRVDDDVARAFAARECQGTLGAPLVAPANEGDPRSGAAATARAIGCARIAGRSVADVRVALAAELASRTPGEGCAIDLQELAKSAAPAPPLRVEPIACAPVGGGTEKGAPPRR